MVAVDPALLEWGGVARQRMATLPNDGLVIPEADKTRILRVVEGHDKYVATRAAWRLDEHTRYGRGVVLMTLLLTELERLEDHAILATNCPQLRDDALDRRILVRVDFRPPDRAAREAIWQCLLPAQLPLASDVNLADLADRHEI